MNQSPIEVYCGNAASIQEADASSGAQAVYRYLETFYANNKSVPWKTWFEQRPTEMNALLECMQMHASYSTYAEHFFNGMDYWDEKLILSDINIKMMPPFLQRIPESTWQSMAQRGEGHFLQRVIKKIRDDTGVDLTNDCGNVSASAMIVCVYNGFLDRCVKSFDNDELIWKKLSNWCERATRDARPELWTIFCNKYPAAGGLLVYKAIEHYRIEQTQAIVDSWIAGYPEYHEAVYACFQHGARKNISNIISFGGKNADRIQHNHALLVSLFPEIKEPGHYIRAYMSIFQENVPTNALCLPLDFNA